MWPYVRTRVSDKLFIRGVLFSPVDAHRPVFPIDTKIWGSPQRRGNAPIVFPVRHPFFPSSNISHRSKCHPIRKAMTFSLALEASRFSILAFHAIHLASPATSIVEPQLFRHIHNGFFVSLFRPAPDVPLLSSSTAARPGSADSRTASRQSDTTTAGVSALEHGRVPVCSRVSISRSHPLESYSAVYNDGYKEPGPETHRNISGTMKNRTWLPRMYTCSRWLTRPSRAVTVMSLSWTFMLSSAIWTQLEVSQGCDSIRGCWVGRGERGACSVVEGGVVAPSMSLPR